MRTSDISALAERVLEWQGRVPWPLERGAIAAAAVVELAAGEPVELARVAVRAGVPADDVLDFLHATPAEFDNDGRLVGFGLTLRPTPHRVELGARTLYTWCAPDTLELAVLLGQRVRVESRCFATGEPVRAEVDPDGVRAVEPDDAVLSMVLPDVCMSDFRQKLCDEQHFFSSAAAASRWHAERPEAIVVPVRSGFALSRLLLGRLFGEAAVA
jgi:alkylmercury lyase